MALCLRDMGRRYPKEFEINPDGRTTVHFWPPAWQRPGARPARRGHPLHTGTARLRPFRALAGPGGPAELHLRPEGPDGLPELGTVRDMGLADPTGVAATYDVLYFFYRGAANPQEIAGICKLLRPAPARGAKHGEPRGGQRDARYAPPRTRGARGETARPPASAGHARGPVAGEFNFQDVRRGWLPNEQRGSSKTTGWGPPATAGRAMVGATCRRAGPEALLAASARYAIVMDVDMCHEIVPVMETQADPRRRKVAGGFGDHRTPGHWQATWRLSDRTPRLRGLLLSYYVTGDLLARDTALASRAGAVDGSGVPFPGEDGMVFLDNLSEFLALDYDSALLEKLGECADYLFRMPPMIDEADAWTPGLRVYAAQTGDPRVAGFCAASPRPSPATTCAFWGSCATCSKPPHSPNWTADRAARDRIRAAGEQTHGRPVVEGRHADVGPVLLLRLRRDRPRARANSSRRACGRDARACCARCYR